jgi:hypothetical protein
MFLNIISIQNLSLTRGMDFFSGVWHLNLWTEHMSASINKHQVFFAKLALQLVSRASRIKLILRVKPIHNSYLVLQGNPLKF